MNIRRLVLGGVAFAVTLVVIAFALIPAVERVSYLAVTIPLGMAFGVLGEWMRTRPAARKRELERQELANRPRYGEPVSRR